MALYCCFPQSGKILLIKQREVITINNDVGLTITPMKNNYCEICGNSDLVLSEIQLKACYGSRHDGESLTLKICGNCIDRIIDYINSIDEKKG